MRYTKIWSKLLLFANATKDAHAFTTTGCCGLHALPPFPTYYLWADECILSEPISRRVEWVTDHMQIADCNYVRHECHRQGRVALSKPWHGQVFFTCEKDLRLIGSIFFAACRRYHSIPGAL